ncbi:MULTISPECIES: hypothetical protein [Trichocoleus]|uniref:NurA domain-containing protein n=1 Tax=Trichocoleus desertorum GB2-A4 TaxID=2933944 RepID=A0ABV0JE69_9CYAN|nr:hypothetical protein [Trichocoleus sp. FACHB-46]MBD1863992.1 hypothetical protein [Trichocoleus sp. FACHB-46]
MRFDLYLQAEFQEQLDAIVGDMQLWQGQISPCEGEEALLRKCIQCFSHTTQREALLVAGVDGSGDFPMLSYADSFVYMSVAQATVYAADFAYGLRELEDPLGRSLGISWLPEHNERGPVAFEKALERAAGLMSLGWSLMDVIQESDYRQLKAQETGKKSIGKPGKLFEDLIRPHASDTGNVAIQLRSTAEMGAAFRLLVGNQPLNYLLMDTTFALPLVTNPKNSLFYEHLKRLCCVKARGQDIGFFTLSKSHGLPGMEFLERIAAELQGLVKGDVAEHWYLRVPEPDQDQWALSMAQGRRLPPPGAVSYLVRFHKNTPVMRLDMDRAYWKTFIKGSNDSETQRNESRVFEDLDYASHDQRAFGYPYPIKAAHDRASLTQTERLTYRKQLIAKAIAGGMNPNLFRDPSMATGHR